jgi:hypothetical protein
MTDEGYVSGGWAADDSTMADLRTWLVEQGFVVVSDRYDAGSFGDQEVTLTRPVAVRLVRDRDQWRIDVLGADGRWTGIESLRDVPRTESSRSLSAVDQAATLRTVLADLEKGPPG